MHVCLFVYLCLYVCLPLTLLKTIHVSEWPIKKVLLLLGFLALHLLLIVLMGGTLVMKCIVKKSTVMLCLPFNSKSCLINCTLITRWSTSV